MYITKSGAEILLNKLLAKWQDFIAIWQGKTLILFIRIIVDFYRCWSICTQKDYYARSVSPNTASSNARGYS